MKKIDDSRLAISKNNGKYVFGIKPDKEMINAMKIFLKDKELQDPNRFGLCDDAYFSLFRNMPKYLWKHIEKGKPMPLDRKQIFCMNGEFHIQDAKINTIK